MNDPKRRDLAAEVDECKRRSIGWMENNFYPQWEKAFKNYLCERDPETDEKGRPNTTLPSVGMPDTFAVTQRLVARITAQIPNLRFRTEDPTISEIISRSLMYQWDRGRVQRQQKRHILQSAIFGWSVRGWYWAKDVFPRKQRVDLLRDQVNPETLARLAQQYGGENPEALMQALSDPAMGPMVAARLMSEYSRNGRIPIDSEYCSYEGPRAEFIFVGDCYPEPGFQSIQESKFFIVERRRDRDYLERLVKIWPETFAAGVQELLRDYPNGSQRRALMGRDQQRFMDRLYSAIGMLSDERNTNVQDPKPDRWTITEMHVPGRRPKLRLVAEGNILLGEMDYPYDLDGRIAFTEAVLLDSLLHGVGDSIPRVMRGLQELRNINANARAALVNTISKPVLGTTNYNMYEHPEEMRLREFGHYKLLYMPDGPGSLWVQPEQAAMSALAATLGENTELLRQIQYLSGESNMTQAANVDPAQARTATGARLMAYNQDVLTKHFLDMLNESSIKPDVEIMFAMNRSEFSDAEWQKIYAPDYNRNYGVADPLKDKWVQIEAWMWNSQGEIIPEVGSTLADDDEARVQKAQSLFGMASNMPMLFNMDKVRDEVLIAYGKGRELDSYRPPPPQPPPLTPPKVNYTVSVPVNALPPEVAVPLIQQVMALSGGQPQGGPPQGGMPPEMMGGPPMPQGEGEEMMPPDAMHAALGVGVQG